MLSINTGPANLNGRNNLAGTLSCNLFKLTNKRSFRDEGTNDVHPSLVAASLVA